MAVKNVDIRVLYFCSSGLSFVVLSTKPWNPAEII